MAQDETLCFSCGQPVGDPPKLNRLESGQVCRTCSDRVLDSLQPPLPGSPTLELEPEDEVESWQLGPSGTVDGDGGDFDAAS